ncbi:MAG: hypothetical protein EBR79_03735 [Proteobacteria bacterium]|nr:hypothetical protein [Pseudomonadota bacterium]NBX86378.1 hypothetical protein [Pseudomonadota bacterium]
MILRAIGGSLLAVTCGAAGTFLVIHGMPVFGIGMMTVAFLSAVSVGVVLAENQPRLAPVGK